MANGYIGKISAVVTANTADLSAKLAGAVKDVDRFANSLNRSISASANQATASLDKIFTPLQRLERKLQTALKLNLRTDDQVRAIQQAVSVAEQLNKPLAAAATSFSKLSVEVQAAFLPALDRAQSAVVNLSTTLQQQGSVTERSFGQVGATVDNVTKALQRLTQAQQLAAQSFSGKELQFTNPQLFEALNAGAAATKRAAGLPASQLSDGDIARQVRALNQYQAAAVEADAKVSALRLDPNVDLEVLVAAERRLVSLTETAKRAAQEINAAIGRVNEGQSTDVSGRLRAIDAVRRASEEEAAYRQRAADDAEREAAATARTSRFDAGELNRRSGATARASGDAFEAATAGVVSSSPTPDTRFIGAIPNSVDAVLSRVRELDQVYQKLPASVRAALDPQVNTLNSIANAAERGATGLGVLEDQYNRVKASVDKAAAAITQANTAAGTTPRQEASQNFANAFGGAGTAGLGLGVDQQALRGIGGEIEFVQQKLAGIGKEFRGPAIAALEAFRARAARLFSGGSFDTESARAELQQLRSELVKTLSAAGAGSEKKVAASLKRVGDVARGSFGGAGLAIQQAAFAVDDFFSVTGDLDQRVRAAGNNLSQLGFILGGTTGLVVGIAASIGGQLVAALIKWANNGKSVVDTTKAINESLSKQKSTVDELAQSFRSLADSVADGVFSDANRDIRILSEGIERLRREQDRARSERTAARDPRTIALNADDNRIDRLLQEEPTRFEALIAERRKRENARQRESVRQLVAATPAPTVSQSADAIRTARIAVTGLGSYTPRGARTQAAVQSSARLEQLAAGITDGGGADSLRAQLAALTEAQSIIQSRAESGSGSARRSFFELGDQIALVEREFAALLDSQALDSVRAISALGGDIAENLGILEQALGAGVQGVSAAVARQEELGAQLRDARDRLAASLEIEDVQQRDAAQTAAQNDVRAIEQKIEATRQEVAAIDVTRRATERFAAALERATAEAQRNLSQAQSRADEARAADLGASTADTQAARRRAEEDLVRQQELASNVEAESAAARERFQADASAAEGDRRRFEEDTARRQREMDRAQRTIDLVAEANAASAEATQLAGGNATAGTPYNVLAQQQMDAGNAPAAARITAIKARQEEIASELGLSQAGGDTFWGGLDSAMAEARDRLDQLTSEQRQAEADMAASTTGQMSAEQRQIVTRMNEIDSLLQTTGVLADGQRDSLVRERARLEQQAIELDPAVQTARDASTRDAERTRRREESIARGRELAISEEERAAREYVQGLADIRANFAALGDAAPPEADQQRTLDRFQRDFFRQQAPAIFGLADQVANAVLQGPSRAALQAADVSTTQGAVELNRLLRGDDAARNQDLVQLQREANRLLQIIADEQAAVANN